MSDTIPFSEMSDGELDEAICTLWTDYLPSVLFGGMPGVPFVEEEEFRTVVSMHDELRAEVARRSLTLSLSAQNCRADFVVEFAEVKSAHGIWIDDALRSRAISRADDLGILLEMQDQFSE